MYLLILCLLALSFLHTPANSQTTRQDQLRQALRGVVIRYNRVEGMFTGYHIKLSPHQWKGLSVFAQTGYGIQSDGFRWGTGVGWAKQKYGLKFTVFDRTATNDEGMIHTTENTLFALLFKGDYRDYYRAKNGFSIQATYKLKPKLELRGSLDAFKYENMPVATHWSVLRKNKLFRPNPTITPGNVGLFQAELHYDTRRRVPRFLNAWHLYTSVERGFREFPYTGLLMGLTRFQKTIWGNQAFIVKARLGTRNHTAEQFLFDLGGVGTLRGYDIKEFSGNRMFYASVDYLFRGDIFAHIPIPASHLFNLILFADTGWTYSAPRSENILRGFENLNLTDFKTDIGLAIGMTERLFRLNVARRLDRSSDYLVISARFFREF